MIGVAWFSMGGGGHAGRKLLLAAAFSVVVVVLLLALAGRFHRKVDSTRSAAAAERPVGDARLAPVRTRRVAATETAVGSIRAVHETTVASKLLARVVEVNVRAGQRVSRDDVLVRLDDADLSARAKQSAAAVAAAEAATRQARTERQRVADLFQRSAAAKIELDRVETALKAAEAEQQQAEQSAKEAETVLDYATIRAPIDGIVVDKKVESGDTVTPGQPLLGLYDPTRMQLVARVRESLTQRLAIGQTIDVQVDALGKTCQGRISEIVPEAESASRSFSVKVTGPCPPGIYSGMFGRLLVPLDEQDVLVVPREAVRRIGQLDVVDVADGGVLRRRTVRLGRTFEGDVEVLGGLKPGERVRLNGGTPSPGKGV